MINRLICVLTALYVAHTSAGGWTVSGSGPAPARDSAAVIRLVDLARSLPGEFKADVLLRLAEAGKLGSPGDASSLLEEAFIATFSAQERVRLESAVPTGTSGLEDARTRALANQLDQLTLETRALRALASIDADKARTLEAFVRVDLPRLDCRDALVFNVDDAYRQLAAFAAAIPDA